MRTLRKLRLGFGLALFGTLTSCSGGDSGSGKVVIPGGGTSAPGAGGSASGGSLNTGEIKPTTDATFLSATMEMTTTSGTTSDLTGQSNGGTTSSRLTILDTPGFTGSYSATTGYQLRDAINNATFGPAQLTSDTTASDFYPTVLFTRLSSPVADYLALYRQSVKTSSPLGYGTVAPKYAGVGGWQHSVSSSASRRTRVNYFAFGPATPVGSMPHSGVVKFTIVGAGNYAEDKDLYFTTPSDTLTVDFAAGTISGSIGGSGQNLFTGGSGGLYVALLKGTINGNAATGSTFATMPGASGQYRLVFVGPNADELILTHVGQYSRGDYVGALVGIRNPYLL